MRIQANYKKCNYLEHINAYLSEMTWVDNNVRINEGVQIYHFTVLRENVEIGKNTVIGHNVVIERDTMIGERTTIQSQCHITANAIIGNDCFFGPGVMTMNEKNIANQGRVVPKIEQLIVGNGVRIGTGSILAPGITIGHNAFIKAGSFVTKDVGEGEVWANLKDSSRASKIGMVPKEEWL